MRRFLSLLFLPALLTTALAQNRGASLTSIAPTFGPPGTVVSIRGKGFSGFEPGSPWVKDLATEAPPGIVEFNGVPGDVLFWEDDLITVKVPKHASSGPVRIVLLETRAVLAAEHFDVYYSTADEGSASRSQLSEHPVRSDIEDQNESRERPLFFDYRVPEPPLYINPWFSSLTPGERTFFSENGFWFGNSFTFGRGGSSFNRRRDNHGFGFDRFRFDRIFFPGSTIRGPHNFGMRPFGFSFDNHFSSFRNGSHNQGHTFRR